MKRLALFLLVAMVGVGVGAQEIFIARSTDKTSEDLPLNYAAQKTVFNGRRVELVGSVKNTGGVAYRYVKIYFTASSSAGEFIARTSCYADPSDIAPGQVGYIDCSLDVDGKKPGKIEWSVLGRE